MFIKLNESLLREDFDVETFVVEVLEEAHGRNEKLSKDIFKFMPAEVACLASFDNFKLFMAELVTRKMPHSGENKTWSMVYKCRNNNKFAKFEFIDFLDGIIPKNYRHIDYNGDYNIVIDITQHFMCLLITTQYLSTNKFSMSKKAEKIENDEEKEDGEGEDKLNEEPKREVRTAERNDEGEEEKSDIDLF